MTTESMIRISSDLKTLTMIENGQSSHFTLDGMGTMFGLSTTDDLIVTQAGQGHSGSTFETFTPNTNQERNRAYFVEYIPETMSIIVGSIDIELSMQGTNPGEMIPTVVESESKLFNLREGDVIIKSNEEDLEVLMLPVSTPA